MKISQKIPYKYLVKFIRLELKFLSWCTNKIDTTNANTLVYKKSSLDSKIDEFLNNGFIVISNDSCMFKSLDADANIVIKFTEPLDFIPDNYMIVSNKASYSRVRSIYSLIIKMESNGLDLRLVDFSIYKAMCNLATTYINHAIDKTTTIEKVSGAYTRYERREYNNNNNLLNSMVTNMMNNIILDI